LISDQSGVVKLRRRDALSLREAASVPHALALVYREVARDWLSLPAQLSSRSKHSAVAGVGFPRGVKLRSRLTRPRLLISRSFDLKERYFFRANDRGITVNDDIGEEFSMLHDAEVYATIVANELARNRTQVVTVSVLSEEGVLLVTVSASSDGYGDARRAG
jgi:hypothetical protein